MTIAQQIRIIDQPQLIVHWFRSFLVHTTSSCELICTVNSDVAFPLSFCTLKSYVVDNAAIELLVN